MTKVKRVFMLSDTHLGLRSNNVEWLKIIESYFFDFFIPLCKKEYKEGDILFHLGDVFDNRQTLGLFAQNLAIRIFEELGKIFPEIHIIVGNHDVARKNTNDITSIECLKYIPNVRIYKEPKVLNIQGKKCLLMPWRKDKEHEIETISQYPDVAYIFCHSEVNGLRMNSNPKIKSEHANDVKIFKNFKKIYSGHIHYSQIKNNFVLVGNPYEMTRSDSGNRKGIFILDLEKEEEIFFENNYSPKFLKMNIISILEMSLDDIRDKIKNNFIDIYIPSELLTKYNFGYFLNLLEGYSRKLEPQIYEKEQEKTIMFEDIEGDGEYKSFDIFSLSKTYVQNTQYSPEIKERILNSIKELYKDTQSKQLN